MNFKLANLSTINQKYGKTIEQMKDATWERYVKSQTIYLQGYQ